MRDESLQYCGKCAVRGSTPRSAHAVAEASAPAAPGAPRRRPPQSGAPIPAPFYAGATARTMAWPSRATRSALVVGSGRRGLPAIGQQLVDAAQRVRGDAKEDVGQIREWVLPV